MCVYLCVYVFVEDQNSAETHTGAVDERKKKDRKRRGSEGVFARRFMNPCLNSTCNKFLLQNSRKREREREVGSGHHGTEEDSKTAGVCLWD